MKSGIMYEFLVVDRFSEKLLLFIQNKFFLFLSLMIVMLLVYLIWYNSEKVPPFDLSYPLFLCDFHLKV